MKKSKMLLVATSMVALLFSACNKKDAPLVPALAEFSTYDVQEKQYLFNDDVAPFKLPIGLTQKSNKDVTINYTITSSTGAVEGVQYTVNKSKSVTIKAGNVSDTLLITGIFEGYTDSRIDTLQFTITGGDVAVSHENATFKMVLRRHCPFILSNLLGKYPYSYELESGNREWGPYETVVTELYPGTFGKTDTLLVKNFSDIPDDTATARIIVDWNDPFNVKVTLLPTFLFSLNDLGPIAAINRKDGQVIVCDGDIGINWSMTYKQDGVQIIQDGSPSTVLRRKIWPEPQK